ncbi:MAG: hypothetical protein U0451_04125 [Candidatus Saccharimonadales bacterium]
MDKTARIILAVAVAIVYPILVLIGVVQFISVGDSTPPVLPDQGYNSYESPPVCNSVYNYDSNRSQIYDQPVNNSYEQCRIDQEMYYQSQQEKERQRKTEMDQYQKSYEEFKKDSEKELLFRALAIVVISTISIVVTYFIKDIKELAGGLVISSSLMLFGAVTTLAVVAYNSDYLPISTIVILTSFIVMIVLLHVVENNMTKQVEQLTATAIPIPTTLPYPQGDNGVVEDQKDFSESEYVKDIGPENNSHEEENNQEDEKSELNNVDDSRKDSDNNSPPEENK